MKPIHEILPSNFFAKKKHEARSENNIDIC